MEKKGIGRAAKAWLPFCFVKKRERVLLISGKSMEPTIQDKSLVTVDFNDSAFYNGKVYIIRLSVRALMVKRLRSVNGRILACSDNKEYRSFFIEEEQILGRVINTLIIQKVV